MRPANPKKGAHPFIVSSPDRSTADRQSITKSALREQTQKRKGPDTQVFLSFCKNARTRGRRIDDTMDYALSLPAELMCIVLDHLPDPWWVAAARTCRWWRACAHTAWVLLQRSPYMCGPCPELRYTLNVSVLGGYVGAALWAADIVGIDLRATRSVTEWMASTMPHSWLEAVTKAVLIERDDVALWIARHGLGEQRSLIAEVAAAHGCAGRIEKLSLNGRTSWSHRVLPCALARGDTRCVDLLLANERVPVRLQAAYIAAITMPQYVDAILLRVNPYPRNGTAVDGAVRWLAAQNLPFDGSSRADVIQSHLERRHGAIGPVAKPLTWPSMRRLSPADLLRGGALAEYFKLDRRSASIRKYIRHLFRPLLMDKASCDAVKRILRHHAQPPALGRFGQRIGTGNYMGARVNFMSRSDFTAARAINPDDSDDSE